MKLKRCITLKAFVEQVAVDLILIELTDAYTIYDFCPEGKQEEYGRLRLDCHTGKISTLVKSPCKVVSTYTCQAYTGLREMLKANNYPLHTMRTWY